MKDAILDSWKSVADYLGHSVRTCQRLERDAGLPIHRLDSSPKAHIFAYKHDLDHWLEKTAYHLQKDKRHRRAELAGLAVLAALALAAFRFFGPRAAPRPAVPAPLPAATGTVTETSVPFLDEARATERAYVTECDPKDLELAIRLFEQAIAASPGNAAARFGLGSCYQNEYIFNGQKVASFAAMASAYQEALRLAPDRPEAQLGMGWLRLLSGNNDEAYGWFVKARDLAPSSPWVNYQLGVFLGYIGLVEKGIGYISRAIDLGERSTRTYRMRAHFEMMAGQFAAASADTAKLCEANPTNGKMFCAHARALLMQRDCEGAARELNVAAVLSPDDPDVGLTRALLAAARGERDKALGIVNTLRAQAAVPSVLVAQIYALLGMGEEAIAELRRALEADRRLLHRVAVPYAFLANTQNSAFDQLRNHPGFRAIVAELMAEHDDLLKRYSGL